jgi:beta-glucosidase
VDVSFAEEVKGLLETYYAGSYGAVALAEVLYGKISPAGRLAESFPLRLEDVPSYKDFGAREVVYREKEFVGYRYYTTYGVKTAYPFGFGLSYCDFAITNVAVAQTDAYTFTIACDVENKSDFEGKETLQIYLQATSPFEPKTRLLEFASVRLAPREKKHVEIAVERESFVYYRGGKKRLYEGEYALCLGRSCEDIVAQKAVVLQAEMAGAFHENTMMGELLGDERYRDILLRYTEKAIKTWAFGDENTDKNFEEDTFLKMHVYDMPLRGIA